MPHFAEAASIRGVGDRMADKVAEILNYGQLQRTIEVCTDEKAKVVDLFNRGTIFILV